MMVQILQTLWHCLMYCNSCVNPFIYNHASKDFRDGFRDVMSRWRLRSGGGGGTVITSGQAATRPQGDTADSAGPQVRADAADANNEDADNEFTAGGVYCGPSVELIQMELNPHSPSSTYV